MKSISPFTLWARLSIGWQFAIEAYLGFRILYFVWGAVILTIFPLAIHNGILFGEPYISIFDLSTSQGYVYSSVVDGRLLEFQAVNPIMVTDLQTRSLWDFRTGTSIVGDLKGKHLAESKFTAEDVFPYEGVSAVSPSLISIWQRFDANWYLRISNTGYSIGGSTAFFPLYPFLMCLFGKLLGSDFWAGLLLSNLALIGALYLLYQIAATLFDVQSARRAVLYLLIFPSAFFLITVYTESLFLFLSLMSFYYAHRSRWELAAIFGVLSALTRLQGVLLIVPLAFMLWEQMQARKAQVSSFMAKPLNSMRYLLHGIPFLAMPLSTLSFLVSTNLSLIGTYQDELHAKFVLPWNNIFASLSLLATGRSSFIDIFNLIVTLGFGAIMCVFWKKLSLEYTLYSIIMFLAPMFRMTTTQPLVSMSRYMLVVFPVFILWGVLGKNPWLNRAIVYLSLLLQLYLSAQFFLWGWVA